MIDIILIMLVTLTIIGVAFFVGYCIGKEQRKTALPEIPEEEKRKMEKLNKHFQALMNYDVDKATKRVNK